MSQRHDRSESLKVKLLKNINGAESYSAHIHTYTHIDSCTPTSSTSLSFGPFVVTHFIVFRGPGAIFDMVMEPAPVDQEVLRAKMDSILDKVRNLAALADNIKKQREELRVTPTVHEQALFDAVRLVHKHMLKDEDESTK